MEYIEIVMAVEHTGRVLGVIKMLDYQGAEYSYPHGWSELLLADRRFDQVNAVVPLGCADAMAVYYSPLTLT